MTKKATVDFVGERNMRIERIFDAPPDRVWKAMTNPELLAQWWGRGNKLVVEIYEFKRGGHWRFVEHAPSGVHGFEGRFAEINAPKGYSRTFEWDGMPGHVSLETMTLEDLGDGRTKMVGTSIFMTAEDFNGMRQSGMEDGMNQSYAALDRVLEKMA